MALRSSGVHESLHQRPFLHRARHARCSARLMNFRMRPISVLPELRERELRVPNGQGVKKVADQKAQLDAFRADAAAKRETAAPSGHAPDTHLADAQNTSPHTTTSVDGDGTSACSKSPLRDRVRCQPAFVFTSPGENLRASGHEAMTLFHSASHTASSADSFCHCACTGLSNATYFLMTRM